MVDAGDENEQRPIHLAAQNDHTQIVKFFLDTRPSLVSSTTKDGNALAHLAAQKGNSQINLNRKKFIFDDLDQFHVLIYPHSLLNLNSNTIFR